MTSTDHQWFNDESFWERFAPVMFDPERWAEVPAVADGIAALLGRPFGEEGVVRAVVLCCGPGRLTVELALRGWELTGVDITASYLAAAKESAEAASVALELVHEDVRRFLRPNFYDAALNLYTSFGYFEDPADDLLFARNAIASLRPGGAFIIETLGKEIAVRDYTEGEWFERGGYTVLTEYKEVDAWAGLRNRWILIDGAQRTERVFFQRLYAATELRRLLLDAGCSAVELYGDWDGRPYGRDALNLIALGRK